MSGKDKSAQDKAMAANLKAAGIHHGKRQSVTNSPTIPNPNHTGSAKYRREMDKIQNRKPSKKNKED